MSAAPAISLDPVESARAAQLRYVSATMAGIRRLGQGKTFRYVGPDGMPVRQTVLQRIRSLVIPPAWSDVWICPLPDGHLQATGRDARGRKQYRYHPRWKAVRDENKYAKMVVFGEKLPLVRRRVQRDLERLMPNSREKVLAAVVKLLELTCMRIGNEEYARMNRSFGLTTLRDHHVNVAGAQLEFRFRGKSGKEHSVRVIDLKLARIVKRCRDLPGYELFQYIDEKGERHAIDSADVNQYLREICGEEFTAKDFRTWAGTVWAVTGLRHCGPAATSTQRKRNLVAVIKEVSDQLGNTPTVSRKCYIHPSVLDSYADGSLSAILAKLAPAPAHGLRPEESLTLAFLRVAAAAP